MFFFFSHFNSVTNSGITCKAPYKLFVLFFFVTIYYLFFFLFTRSNFTFVEEKLSWCRCAL